MKRHAAVIGLGFGDEGKGTIVDYLTSRHSPYGPKHFSTVVRINGGAQAGHRVVRGDGHAHIFSSFGSGYFNGIDTHLSEFMLVDPLAMMTEGESLDRNWVGHSFQHITVDRRALVVTDFHKEANRAAERARGDARHGSCGMGIGETTRLSLLHPDDVLRVGDLQDKRLLRRKLWWLHDTYSDTLAGLALPSIEDMVEVLHNWANWTKIVDEHYLPLVMGHSNVIFEGAQGVLLDQDYGFHPYTTWSRTTTANIKDYEDVEYVGVLRAYHTRHGAGPFPSEVEEYGRLVPDAANVDGQWQGNFRVGHFDGFLARYAANVLDSLGTPLDSVAVTNWDRIPAGMRAINTYRFWDRSEFTHPGAVPTTREAQESLTREISGATPIPHVYVGDEELPDFIETCVAAPISITSRGPKAEHKTALVRV